MTLAEYVRQLMGEASIYDTAEAAGVSNGGLHSIVRGRTKQPTPIILKRLALYFGRENGQAQEIYDTMMGLADYLTVGIESEEEALASRPTLKDALRATDAAAEQFGLDDPANHGHPLDKKQQNSHS